MLVDIECIKCGLGWGFRESISYMRRCRRAPRVADVWTDPMLSPRCHSSRIIRSLLLLGVTHFYLLAATILAVVSSCCHLRGEGGGIANLALSPSRHAVSSPKNPAACP
ncbi:hypothetical protein PMAYCL1PPCAC_18172, partial [Pristionchus mayeri]